MEKEKLKKGFYLIKADTKDYPLTEERKKAFDNLDIKEEHKDFFKKLYQPRPIKYDLLVELVGENPFLKIKSVKNVVTDVDITNKFLKEVDDVNSLITFTKHLEWIPQNT
jgi:hypothetical protein